MSNRVDWVGMVFGRLTVLSINRREKRANGSSRTFLDAACACGKQVVVGASSLRSGDSTSCGCAKIEKTRARMTTHGASANYSQSPEFKAWLSMRTRVKHVDAYKNRPVCERWQVFQNFLDDMGHMPVPGLSVDRIDNAKGYEPSNCRWATRTQQNRNRSNNRLVTFQGRTLCVGEWAQEQGIKSTTIIWRLNAGWSPEEALTKK